MQEPSLTLPSALAWAPHSPQNADWLPSRRRRVAHRSRCRSALSPRASRLGLRALFFALLAQHRPPAQADLVAFNGKDFDQDLVALLELIANVADPVLGHLADVQQTVGAGKELDERSEFGQANDPAQV